MDLIEIKQRITRLRGNRTKKQFALELGFSSSYLSQIENLEHPQKPSIEALFSIRYACEVSVDYILTGEEHQKILDPAEKILLLENINRLQAENVALLKERINYMEEYVPKKEPA